MTRRDGGPAPAGPTPLGSDPPIPAAMAAPTRRVEKPPLLIYGPGKPCATGCFELSEPPTHKAKPPPANAREVKAAGLRQPQP